MTQTDLESPEMNVCHDQARTALAPSPVERNLTLTRWSTSSQRAANTLVASTGQWRSDPAMPRRITWNGTTDEALVLLHALREHCECSVDNGRTVAICASHAMLVRDQRAVDGLLFMRRMAARLLAEEFDLTPDRAATAIPVVA
jgi:hypothetical protein